MAFTITADDLRLLANLLLEVEPAVANLLKSIFSQLGINVGELQAQAAASLDHSRLFLRAEADRINTQIIVDEKLKATPGESTPEHLFDSPPDPTQPMPPFDPIEVAADITKSKKSK